MCGLMVVARRQPKVVLHILVHVAAVAAAVRRIVRQRVTAGRMLALECWHGRMVLVLVLQLQRQRRLTAVLQLLLRILLMMVVVIASLLMMLLVWLLQVPRRDDRMDGVRRAMDEQEPVIGGASGFVAAVGALEALRSCANRNGLHVEVGATGRGEHVTR